MFNIEGFLDKFYKNIRSAETDKKQIQEILEKHTRINFSLTDIEIKNYIIYIKATPAYLNKVFIYKRNILEDVSRLVPDQKIVDVK